MCDLIPKVNEVRKAKDVGDELGSKPGTAHTKDFKDEMKRDRIAAFCGKFSAEGSMVQDRFNIGVGISWLRNIDGVVLKIMGSNSTVHCDHMGQDCSWRDIGELHEVVAQNGNVLVGYGLKE